MVNQGKNHTEEQNISFVMLRGFEICIFPIMTSTLCENLGDEKSSHTCLRFGKKNLNIIWQHHKLRAIANLGYVLQSTVLQSTKTSLVN